MTNTAIDVINKLTTSSERTHGTHMMLISKFFKGSSLFYSTGKPCLHGVISTESNRPTWA